VSTAFLQPYKLSPPTNKNILKMPSPAALEKIKYLSKSDV
jgi:hypothetical protein